MKLSDYVIKFLADIGIKHVFLVTGGACAHLVDSFRNVENIDYVCTQHEQAGAMAADAYARFSECGIGASIATSGPGATNLITGICCSFFDSSATIFITGNVNTYEYKGDSEVRQSGFQETDIVSIVKPITKYARMVTNPNKIRYYLEKAVWEAKSGRPGPVLIDLPMDVQRAEINLDQQEGFTPPAEKKDVPKENIKECIELMKNAKRPLIIVGGGVRNAGATREIKEFAEKTGFPAVVSFMGLDSFPHDHELFAGFYGTYGTRYGNFAVANSDLLIGVGTRLDTRQTGTNVKIFAREAKKIVVDIDSAELNRRVIADIAFCCDVKDFLTEINKELVHFEKPDLSAWKDKIKYWKQKYPICLPEYYEDDKDGINPYVFMKVLSDELGDSDIILPDAGANLMWAIQSIEACKNRRIYSGGGNSPMGYSFPAAIGASLATGKPAVCTIGDGGFQMNVQDLQTVVHYKIPVKIFIINNHEYGIIKQFQDFYFGSRYEATGRGYSVPDFIKIADAYGLKTVSINKHAELKEKVREVLDANEPAVCDVNIKSGSKIIPKLEVDRPIEDLWPNLSKKELNENMIIEPYDAEKGKKIGEGGMH